MEIYGINIKYVTLPCALCKSVQDCALLKYDKILASGYFQAAYNQ